MISSQEIAQGPYRATKLWNEVVRLFEAGMPTKKHRQLLKTYQGCFTAANATEWLHTLLKANPNFGPHVTRKQTIQLLNKFLKNHIIEDIQGHYGEETLTDNSQLFRLPAKPSPRKIFRQPFSTLSSNPPVSQISGTKRVKSPMQQLSVLGMNSKSLSPEEISANQSKHSLLKRKMTIPPTTDISSLNLALVWKSSFLACLKRILHLRDIDDVTSNLKFNGDWLIKNMTNISSSGVVLSPPKDEMPCWVISAMKCLSNWPDSHDSGLPTYEGFERDVFKAILEYYKALPEPLISRNLYELFTLVLVRCEILDEMCSGLRHSVAIEEDTYKESNHAETNSAMNRIHKQLIQAQMRHENKALRRQRSGRYKKQLFTENVLEAHGENDTNAEGATARESFFEDNPTQVACSDGFLTSHTLDTFVDQGRTTISRQDHISAHIGSRLSVNIGSLPELRACEDNDALAGDEEIDRKFRRKAFRSEFDLSRIDDLDELENPPLEREDMFSSVEDLLLNMSISTKHELEHKIRNVNVCDRVAEELDPVHLSSVSSHLSPRDVVENQDVNNALRSFEKNRPHFAYKLAENHRPQPYLGESSNSKGVNEVPETTSRPADDVPNCVAGIFREKVPVDQSAFYVYSKMASAAQHKNSSNLPQKNRSRVMRRMRSADKSRDPEHRSTWCGNEVTRSKSDIIARREVPPTCFTEKMESVNRIRDRVVKLPYVSESSENPLLQERCNGQHFKRLSKSYGSLHRQQSQPTDLPFMQYKSMRLLQEPEETAEANASASKEPQSPLSAALDQARKHLKIIASSDNKQAHTKEAFQLCLLLLPPGNRRKLHLLLRMMTKMIINPHLLTLDNALSVRSLLIERFTDCVIRSSDHSASASRKLSERVFCFLLDNATAVMKVHERLKTDVEEKRKKLIENTSGTKQCAEGSRNLHGGEKLRRQYTFCQQVTKAEYESDNGKPLRNALTELLHAIIKDEHLSLKDKRKKLKQFQKCYPDIYGAEFPSEEPALPTGNQKKPLFSGAFRKLKNLRL